MRNKSRILIMGVFLLFLAPLILVSSEEERDSDLDGVPDATDEYPFDYDNDGMPDIWEKKHGLRYDKDDSGNDPDNDKIDNIDEYKQGTDPFLSEDTNVKVVQKELFSPFERAIVKVLVWWGGGLLILLTIGFLLYRVHILRIFKFAHHLSKEHFDGEHSEREKARMMPHRPMPRFPPQQRPYPHGVVQRAVMISPRQPVQQPQIRREYQKLPIQKYLRPIKKEVIERKVPQKRETLGGLQTNLKEKKEKGIKGGLRNNTKHGDVFGRPSEHVDVHRKLKSIVKGV